VSKYAEIRMTREQLQAVYERLFPVYAAEVAGRAPDAPPSPLALAFVKVSDALVDLDRTTEVV
jgi:hypothetical protein